MSPVKGQLIQQGSGPGSTMISGLGSTFVLVGQSQGPVNVRLVVQGPACRFPPAEHI
jgi:hypothetical protein